MNADQSVSVLFSDDLLEYVHQHVLVFDTEYDPYRGVTTCWLDASLFKEGRIPFGNAIQSDKLERVSAWLAREPLGLDDAQGRRIGLPILSIGCSTGSFKLVEGNHRVHVLIEERGASRVPVQLAVVQDSWEVPECEETCMRSEQAVDDFFNNLLDILYEAGHIHCGLWTAKEVWRAALYHVLELLVFKDKHKHGRCALSASQ